jgi:hypothetical protein
MPRDPNPGRMIFRKKLVFGTRKWAIVIRCDAGNHHHNGTVRVHRFPSATVSLWPAWIEFGGGETPFQIAKSQSFP